MPHLTVSTVVPTYNRAGLLDRALLSAVPQCGPGDEVIVVDDGSSDDIEAVVLAHGPCARYLQTPHLGAGAARNVGVQAATGDLVAFLDSDDAWQPWKVGVQRAVLEQRPEILFVFSGFGQLMLSGEQCGGGMEAWRGESPQPWGDLLEAGEPSSCLAGLPSSAPCFDLRVGRLYETFLWCWCVFTSTVMVRREAAGDALQFPEDLPTFEDLECYARLAQRGVAGFMDCETAWQGHHPGGHLSDADVRIRSDAALALIRRVWGADEEYLRMHRREYEAAMDWHRARKVRYLLGRGMTAEARAELALFSQAPPRGYRALTYVPGRLTSRVAGFRRRRYALRSRHDA
jgi:glycosyltransferase involved in cell wall biosynthesis